MRTFFGVLLLVVGLPVLIAATAAAVYVGPDNTIDIVSGEQVTADTPVLTTGPSTIEAAGPTLHIAVDSDTETFLGAAHPIHVDSYLEGITVTQVTEASWRGDLTFATIDGDGATPLAQPEGLDWWREAAHGTGVQQIEVELTDEPFRIVVVPIDLESPADVRLTVGAEFSALFVTALLLAGVGLLLTIVGIVLLRSGRRRRRRRRQPRHGRSRERESPPLVADDDTSGADFVRRSAVSRLRTRARLAGLVAAGPVVLTGCAQLPGEADYAAYTTVTAVTPEAAESFFTHYTEINNQANTSQDSDLLATVETGTLLTSSQMGYEIQQAQERDPLEAFTVTPTAIASPRFDSYPMWFYAMATAEDAVATSTGYYLVTRADATSPWLATLSLHPPSDASVPEPAITDGVAAQASLGLVNVGVQVLDSLVEYAETGEEPEDIDVTAAGGLNELHQDRIQIVEGPEDQVSVEHTCVLQDDEVRWLATEGGALALAAIACTQEASLEEGFGLNLGEAGHGTLPGDTDLSSIEVTYGVTFIVSLEEGGSTRVIGEQMLPYSMSYTEE